MLVLLGIVAVIWIFAIQPALSWRATVEHDLASSIDESERLEEGLQGLRAQLENLETVELDHLVWEAQQAGELTARIQAELGAIARRSGVTLRSVTPTQAAEFPMFRTTALRIEAEADLAQLITMLVEIEQHEPVLVVSRANLRRLNRPGRTSEQPLVFLQLDIAAPVLLPEVN